jgi:hypothetical protein
VVGGFLWGSRSRLELVTCGDRRSSRPGTIMDMLFCFLSLIFDRLLGWLMLLGRALSSKTGLPQMMGTRS